MSLARKISRNVLKKQQGNNRINQEWQRFMSYKYSEGELEELRRRNKRK